MFILVNLWKYKRERAIKLIQLIKEIIERRRKFIVNISVHKIDVVILVAKVILSNQMLLWLIKYMVRLHVSSALEMKSMI